MIDAWVSKGIFAFIDSDGRIDGCTVCDNVASIASAISSIMDGMSDSMLAKLANSTSTSDRISIEMMSWFRTTEKYG